MLLRPPNLRRDPDFASSLHCHFVRASSSIEKSTSEHPFEFVPAGHYTANDEVGSQEAAMASPLSLAVCRAFYGLNILGAGRSGLQLLLQDDAAVKDFWGGPVQPPLASQLVGSTWVGVALTSALGLVAPVAFSPLLLFQATYKLVLLLTSTLPALRRNAPADRAAIKLGLIFAPYVLVLPFFLPWDHLRKDLRG